MIEINGIQLPDLPSDVDRSVFPYAWIVEFINGAYALYFSTQVYYFEPSSSEFKCDAPITLRMYMANPNDESWTYYTEQTSEEPINGTPELDFLWLDFDVKNIETGEVVIPSSVKPLFYYNGVRLSELPSDVDREAYPYIMIANGGGTYLGFFTSIPFCYSSEGVCYITDNTSMINYTINVDGWVKGDEANLGGDGTNKIPFQIPLLWSDYDITNPDTNEIYFKGTQAYSEEETASITLKTLCDLGDAIREVTGDSTLRKPKEIIAKVKTLIGGVSGGYVVSFYDENEEMLAVHSIKQGNSTNAPNYTCKKWIDTDGNVITFPYTPTEGICFYANSDETFDDVLYEFYDIDKAVYPYVCIVLGGTYNNSCDIFFGKTISTNSTSNITLTGVMYKSANFNLNISDFANIEEVIDLVITNVPKLQERSDWSTGGGEKYYLYANFENNLTNIITKYRLDQ